MEREPVYAPKPTIHRWDFSRWMDGLRDFRWEEPTADRVPAHWKGADGSGGAWAKLNVQATDPDAAVELLLVRDKRVLDGRLSTTIGAFEIHGAPESTKDIPVSRHWPNNPAGGGVIWRARGFEDGYVVLCDLRNDRVGLYRMQNRGLQLLAEARHEMPRGIMRTRACPLDVIFVGSKFVVEVEGTEVLTVEDSTFSAPGEVGLAAYGASEAEFWELLLEEY